MASQAKIPEIEARFGRPITGLLTQLYVIEGLSEAQVARRLGVAQVTVHTWMVRYGIPRREWAYPGRSHRETEDTGS